jgi:4-hydroxyphenylpyruvate dioxygenase
MSSTATTKTASATNPLGMRGLSFVELACAPQTSTTISSLFSALGFSRTHRHRARAVHAFRQGAIELLLSEEPRSHAHAFAAAHGPSISALGLAFDDPREAFAAALRRGASAYDGSRGPATFDAPAIFGIGDSLIYFVDARGSHQRELVALDRPTLARDKGFIAIDHLTNNVAKGELGTWSDFYRNVLGFTEVRAFDIEGQKTGLYSYALRAPCGTFCIPINEDKGEKGQIAEYLREYHGPGVQHLAFSTKDLLRTLDAIGGAVPTLDIDGDYYREVFERVPNVREDHARIERHQVLVDGDASGYLLQIFTKNVIGPIFFEMIQRENHLSFGEGNFSALFRSIERDQEKRGVL